LSGNGNECKPLIHGDREEAWRLREEELEEAAVDMRRRAMDAETASLAGAYTRPLLSST